MALHMKETPITIRVASKAGLQCSDAILVPDVALSEAGHIRTFSTRSGREAKHTFYAISQTARMQFEDEELAVRNETDPVLVMHGDGADEVESGLVICRTLEGEIVVLANSAASHRKLLDAANRFCTRWVRLDI